MIQRIQSLWLLLCAVVTALLFKLPIYGGKLQDGSIKHYLVPQNYLLFITAAVLVLLPAVAISQFKNRPAQKKLIVVSIFLQLVFIALIWMEVSQFVTASNFLEHNYKAGAILPIVSIVLLVLAYQGIRKDEKLIKNAERLR